jgi:hypothetical protein
MYTNSKREPSLLQFPRFTYLENPSAPYSKQVLVNRSPRAPWLIKSEVDLLLHPKTVTGRSGPQNERLANNWNGVSHYSRTVTTIGALMVSPFIEGPAELYRGKLTTHDYLWDAQAFDHTRYEFLLERLPRDQPRFEEVLAILIDYDHTSEQQIVIKDERGEWCAPQTGIDDKRDFLLLTAMEVSSRGYQDLVSQPQQA